MKTASRSESKKMFLNIPTVEEVAKIIGIGAEGLEPQFYQLEMFLNGAPFTRVDDSSGFREVQTWILRPEEYHQGEHAEPVMDPKAWEAAYRRQKLKVVDLEVQLAKLRANWIEFSEHIAACYNKAFGYQMELFELYVKADNNTADHLPDLPETYRPQDEDRDRFFTLLNYLDPAMVDSKTIHND